MTGEASCVCNILYVNLQKPRSESNLRTEAVMRRHEGPGLAQTFRRDSRKDAVMASWNPYFLVNFNLQGDGGMEEGGTKKLKLLWARQRTWKFALLPSRLIIFSASTKPSKAKQIIIILNCHSFTYFYSGFFFPKLPSIPLILLTFIPILCLGIKF